MGEVVRLGMLGSGFIADFYMAGLRDLPGARVTAAYSRSAARAADFARRHGVARTGGGVPGAAAEAAMSTTPGSTMSTRSSLLSAAAWRRRLRDEPVIPLVTLLAALILLLQVVQPGIVKAEWVSRPRSSSPRRSPSWPRARPW